MKRDRYGERQVKRETDVERDRCGERQVWGEAGVERKTYFCSRKGRPNDQEESCSLKMALGSSLPPTVESHTALTLSYCKNS